jgi:uncharacterized protein (TIGR02246 family)
MMNRRRVVGVTAAAIAITGICVVISADGPPQQSAGPAADRDQITATVGRWEAAWNTHDMTDFASLFHDDGVWVLWTGDVWTGRRVIEEGHAAVHKTIFRNSIQREHIEELTFVGPDAAIVRFCSVLTGSEQSPNEPIRSRKFLVMTRRQGVWKVSWGQNTRLRADVPESECFATLRKRGG